MTWNYGTEKVDDVNRMQLREQGFPDSDECPMPLAHRDTEDPWVVYRDDRTRFMLSPTEWISASETWEIEQ